MAGREAFSNTRIVIAEGEEDAAITRAMLHTHRGSLPTFDVSPVIDIGNVGGNTGFRDAVMKADALAGFTEVTDVANVADNDDEPARAFDSIVRQIRAAKNAGNLSRDWAIPTAPCVKAAGDPSVSVWLWPNQGQPGCLETLLWQAVRSETKHRNVVACVDQAITCAGIARWPLSKLDKPRIRCFIALYRR